MTIRGEVKEELLRIAALVIQTAGDLQRVIAKNEPTMSGTDRNILTRCWVYILSAGDVVEILATDGDEQTRDLGDSLPVSGPTLPTKRAD